MLNNYELMVKGSKDLESVISPEMLEYVKEIDQKTVNALTETWEKNIKYNVKHNLPSCGWLNDGALGLGVGKAVIAIGSGPSYNKNKDYLKMISLVDGVRSVQEQDYILMASNHQLKPCLEDGIIPHFAMIADGSRDLVKQFDVGDIGKHTILIAALTAHPKVIEKWPGPVKFVCQKSDVREIASKELGEEIPKDRCFIAGGNILNFSFSIGIGLFRTSVWSCVGNDLSFEIQDTKEERRDSYYADGDYETNIKSKRDEARYKLAWAGYEMEKMPFLNAMGKEHHRINWKLVYTSPQLFVYKTWLEVNSYNMWRDGYRFNIYNCTEGGILGVILKKEAHAPEKYNEKFYPENWMLFDEMVGNKWRTKTLQEMTEEFREAKELLKKANPRYGALYAGNGELKN